MLQSGWVSIWRRLSFGFILHAPVPLEWPFPSKYSWSCDPRRPLCPADTCLRIQSDVMWKEHHYSMPSWFAIYHVSISIPGVQQPGRWAPSKAKMSDQCFFYYFTSISCHAPIKTPQANSKVPCPELQIMCSLWYLIKGFMLCLS